MKKLIRVLAFIAFIGNAQAAPQPLDKIVAMVNNDVITENELDTKLSQIREQIVRAGEPLPDDAILRTQVLDRMIDQSLALQAGEKVGIEVTSADLDRAVESVAKQNKTDAAGLKAMLAEDGVEFEQFLDDLKSQVLLSRVQQGMVGSSIRMSDAEVEHWVSQNENKVQSTRQYLFGHILIALPADPTSEQLEKAEKRAAEAVAALKNQEDFRKVALRYSDSQDVLDRVDLGWRDSSMLPSFLSGIAPSLDKKDVAGPLRNSSGLHIVQLLDLKEEARPPQFVKETHARHILVALNEVRNDAQAKARLQEVIEKLKAGEKFETLAKVYSDDPGSKQTGGDLGWVQSRTLTPKFAEAMESLEIGKYSQPVKTPFGWHLIEVLDRKERDISRDKLREQVQNTLYDRKYQEALQNWYIQLRDQAVIEVFEEKGSAGA